MQGNLVVRAVLNMPGSKPDLHRPAVVMASLSTRAKVGSIINRP